MNPTDIGDFVSEFLFWFFAIFIVVGAIGGWLLIFALLTREQTLKREAELAALDAASHPITGRREAA